MPWSKSPQIEKNCSQMFLLENFDLDYHLCVTNDVLLVSLPPVDLLAVIVMPALLLYPFFLIIMNL